MIICSCNVISDHDIDVGLCSTAQVYNCLGLPGALRALVPLGQKNSARAARRFRGIEDILITGPRPVWRHARAGHKAQKKKLLQIYATVLRQKPSAATLNERSTSFAPETT